MTDTNTVTPPPPPVVLVVAVSGGGGRGERTAAVDLTPIPKHLWPQIVVANAHRLFNIIAVDAGLVAGLSAGTTLVEEVDDTTDPATWRGICTALTGSRFTCYWQGALL